MREWIKRIPVVGPLARQVYRGWVAHRSRSDHRRTFDGSEQYWIARYETGGHSGDGSYGELSEFKAEFINALVLQETITTVIEYGCGDGNQLKLAKYPSYLGFDVSPAAVELCRKTFLHDRSKSFRLMRDYHGETAELTLSLDVLYHLIEDSVFDEYANRLFDSATRFVIIYSSDTDHNEEGQAVHVRHRRFTEWARVRKPDWRLLARTPNRYPFTGNTKTGSFADFFVYQRRR